MNKRPDLEKTVQREDSKSPNQGEGDKESARRYNEATQDFVHSPRGRNAIEQAGDVKEYERAELEDAERAGKARAKGEDPAVTRQPVRPGWKPKRKIGKQ